ncbi:MAG: hypothetical protein DRN66_03080 [Candidatus Nanohalarchaeota archaeon]|nr:MAG: hypothetical protein DRN66_03080 [Candidatus Nanohaloarchaeota archaeon]
MKNPVFCKLSNRLSCLFWRQTVKVGINDKTAKNSEGMLYVLKKQTYTMLSLYEKDYKEVIPKNTCLILDNLAKGSLDSMYFGLIDKKNILGKAVIE